jgi:hypothetical protein
LPVAPNVLDRQIAVAAPNRAWLTEITCIATDEGWLYLAGVKDLFSGEVVGYAISERMTKALVMQALFRACATKRPLEGADPSFRQSMNTGQFPGGLTLESDGPSGRLAPQGVLERPDPHSDRPSAVSFPGPVGRPGPPCGEVLPRRCL